MTDDRYDVSPSGVRIARDFRDNLIIDRYDPQLRGMRAKKLEHMRSENSEDVVTWNVFRSLRQIDPGFWVPRLGQATFGKWSEIVTSGGVTTRLAVPVSPPVGMAHREGPTEVDVVLEAPEWVWSFEAKWLSDVVSIFSSMGPRLFRSMGPLAPGPSRDRVHR